MARILGVEIPDNKKVEIALTYIYGIGSSLSTKILKSSDVEGGKRVKDLNEEELSRIMSYIQKNINIEGDHRQEVNENIRRLKEINCYRGIRHKVALPVRGQRTRTNSRSRKGPKKTVGVVRDKTARKAMKQKMKSGNETK